MKRLLYLSFLSLPLIGCYGGERRNTGECPAGEVCSDLTPTGLDFIGNRLVGELLLSGPRPTAIGGTQAVALEYDRGDGVDVALDLPFSADDDGGIGVRVDAISGSQVVIRGAGSRSAARAPVCLTSAPTMPKPIRSYNGRPSSVAYRSVGWRPR